MNISNMKLYYDIEKLKTDFWFKSILFDDNKVWISSFFPISIAAYIGVI